ncbi:sensor histidine kinase [Lysobacter arvi]|uniref:Two-component regulator propeller domain-containing protein n=1 Tax=Lysobacter arvi TaxID=3038776 RepID=A0ABU1C9Z4_9GAMM|nr:two-component regulator propeller domain-containing protein [Lysobacter arvi]MDR0181958.1 two-component regulator propeller domain-containing protein [Lysobacter arvi]
MSVSTVSNAWIVRWRSVAMALLCLYAGAVAATSWQLPQYNHRAWSMLEGAPADVWALAQTPDGYLWLGTGTGLYRFDGMQFDAYAPPRDRPFASHNITALGVAPDGALWIGFLLGGVSVLHDGQLQHHVAGSGAPGDMVLAFAHDGDGATWVAARDGFRRFDGQRWERVDERWGYPDERAETLMVDSHGTMWVASEARLMYLPAGARRFVDAGIDTGPYASLAEAPGGALWISDGRHGTRVVAMPGTAAAPVKVAGGGFGHFAFMRIDPNGVLWATDRRGGGVVRVSRLERFPPGHVLRAQDVDALMRKRDGLTSDRAIPVLRDREGNVWVGTNLGVHRFRFNNVQVVQDERLTQHTTYAVAFSPQLGLLASSGSRLYRVRASGIEQVVDTGGPKIAGIVPHPHGAWLQAEDGAYSLKDGVLERLRNPGENWRSMTVMAPDGGTGFVAMQEGQGLFRHDGATWQRIGDASVRTQGATALLRDADGGFWIGYAGNRLAHWANGRQRLYTLRDGLNVGAVTALARVRDGLLVAGEAGMVLLRDGRVRSVNAVPADRFNGVTGIVATGGGEIWLNGIKGLIQIPAGALSSALESRTPLRHRLLNASDGLLGIAQQATPTSTAVADATGRLWFATNQGLATLDPARLHRNAVRPTVEIRGLMAGGKAYAAADGLQLPAGTRDLRINYTAPNLTFPSRTQFRYRLEGFDEKWQDAGNRRQAFYTNLEPGSYRFQVMAANESNVWSEPGATFAFALEPRFTQTWWFIALCATAALGVLFVLYLLRMRQIAEQTRMRVEERHLERERIARELHDTLLQSVHGLVLRFQSVANRIPKDDPIRAVLEQVMDRADEVIVEGRDRVRDLRACAPQSALELPDAFARLGNELAQLHPANFSVVVEGKLHRMDAMLRDEVFWIGREALVNAFRHAEARRIDVEISSEARQVTFRFRDDGQGIADDVQLRGHRSGHWGLSGMRERARGIGAQLNVWSRPGSGTEVELRVPYARRRRRKSRRFWHRGKIEGDS